MESVTSAKPFGKDAALTAGALRLPRKDAPACAVDSAADEETALIDFRFQALNARLELEAIFSEGLMDG